MVTTVLRVLPEMHPTLGPRTPEALQQAVPLHNAEAPRRIYAVDWQQTHHQDVWRELLTSQRPKITGGIATRLMDGD